MDKLESVYPSTEINWYFELTIADCISLHRDETSQLPKIGMLFTSLFF